MYAMNVKNNIILIAFSFYADKNENFSFFALFYSLIMLTISLGMAVLTHLRLQQLYSCMNVIYVTGVQYKLSFSFDFFMLDFQLYSIKMPFILWLQTFKMEKKIVTHFVIIILMIIPLMSKKVWQ
uniref:Uncharacterized protein n=1 Tax=Phalansterium sp. PJK-2012 TaxID=1267188 RepID=T1QDY1_9EUKA|nr:hypothetical protein [Phalansterium sp. PJK-2012]